MIDVVFYNIDKRVNSTKLPSNGVTVPCLLKEDSEILNLTLEIHGNYANYNYAKIESFGRYYYITSKRYRQGGIWEYVLDADPLATWKSNILAETAQVEYSSTEYDINITDERFASSHIKDFVRGDTSTPFTFFDATGCYILTVISDKCNGQNGACTSYALTSEQMQTFAQTIYAENFLQTVWESIKNVFINPMECIVSCRWIPIAYSAIGGTAGAKIFLSYKNTGCDAKKISTTTHSETYLMSMQYRRETPSFLDIEPYTQGIIYLPFVGIVPLDLNAYYDSSAIQVGIHLDYITGDLVYEVGCGDNIHSSTYSANCSSTTPLSRNMVDVVGTASASIATIGGAAAVVSAIVAPKKAVFAKVASIAASSATAATASLGTVKSAQVHTQTNGAISSRIGAKLGLQPFYLLILNELLEDFDSEERVQMLGLPCMKTIALADLTGYVKCSNFNISASNMLSSEAEAINNYVNGSGIYIE